ncbi:paired mesoderm homeobox protein 1 [Phodopus roborovskii]|uniref:Rhox11 protein n=1 Tax=Phodopus roborovskii TaxID=109678 RepID=A0AAU9YXQ8_PHORO|nr:paired mesoderm homeobox protein 1 [Phodopus roborovskii]CAH6779919.1 Rhox11 [Phodopus roborovskii]
MARKYFYFDYDYYGVSFYEEEIKTAEPEERLSYSANSGTFDQGVIDALNKLCCEGHQSSLGNHSYESYDMNNNQDTEKGELVMARNMARASDQPSFRIPRKPYKFTPGQLWELRAVFEETQYPDALRRKELAELMNVDEQKVKDWFNNKRAKLRKNQKLIMTNKHPASTKETPDMKTLVESKNVIILQEQVGDGLFWCHQIFDTCAGQNIPVSLPLH